MSARDTFVRVWEDEAKTTMRVLRAFPADQGEMKAHERSRTARDLAWQCAIDERVIGQIATGPHDLRNVPAPTPPPETMDEIVAAYERNHREAVEKIRLLTEEEFNRTNTVVMRGGKIRLPQPDTLWGNLMDQVHHRGQLTVYLRLADGKVPSIYGPSADEPMPSFGS